MSSKLHNPRFHPILLWINRYARKSVEILARERMKLELFWKKFWNQRKQISSME